MGWNLDTIVAAAVPFFFIGIFTEIFYSKKKGRKLYRANDTITNLSLGIVQQLTAVYSKAFPIFMFKIAQDHFQFFTLPPRWTSWVISFILVDFAYYWFHRCAHQVNIIWASHVAHHSSEEYNLSVALRQSSVQMFFSTFFYLPLVLLGVTWEMFGICFGLNLIYQFWIHTEVVKNFGIFDHLLNSTSHHRVHHGRNPKYIDKNHAGVFIVWDKLFGTYQEEEEKPIYGITTPLQTFNPLMANLHHFGAIWGDLKQSKGLLDRLQVLFRKPGWRPSYLGGPLEPKEVDLERYQKFNPTSSKRQLALNVFGFILLTILAVILQNFYSKFHPAALAMSILIELALLAFIGVQLSKVSADPNNS